MPTILSSVTNVVRSRESIKTLYIIFIVEAEFHNELINILW